MRRQASPHPHGPLLLMAMLLGACGDKGDGSADTATSDCVPDASVDGDPCDGEDNDCDGQVDEDAEFFHLYADGDSDGFGDPATTLRTCENIPGFTGDDSDCDDTDAHIHPGADETCDGIDNDCDALVDDADGSTMDAGTWYADADADGYGAGPAFTFCTAPSGFSEEDGDCQDQDAAINPGEVEICDGNGVDEDCNGLVDSEDPDATGTISIWPDVDGDGYGAEGEESLACAVSSGQAAQGGDCDDGDKEVSPDADEICRNGVDDDCDGVAGDCLPIDPAMTVADTSVKITGQSVSAGVYMLGEDLNGDGRTDLVVSDTGYGSSGTGGIFAYGALAVGDSRSFASAGTSVTGQTGTYLGRHLVGGDLDGDGYDDLIAADSDTTVWAWAGPITGATTTSSADHSFTSGPYATTFSRAMTATDLNGDGSLDLLVSRYADQEAYVLLGPISGSGAMAARADVTITTSLSSSQSLGRMVSAAGDMDGDGVEDAWIADPYDDTSALEGGAVYLISKASMASSTDIADVQAVLYGTEDNADFGAALAGGGDLNGDGYDDVAISASYGQSYGAIYAFLGPLTGAIVDLDASTQIIETGTDSYLGFDLAGGADLDGDGADDLIASQLGESDLAAYGGAALIWYGPLGAGTLRASNPDGSVEGSQSGGYLGHGIAAVGDVMQTGASDLAISGYQMEEIYLFEGLGL